MMSSRVSRRRVLVLAAAAGSGGLGGCLTAAPTLRAPTIRRSKVFKNIEVSESWSTNHIPASISLSSDATTQYGVRGLVVIDSSGDDFWTGTVDVGQTSVSAYFPVDGPATLSATDYDGRLVEQLHVRIHAEALF